MLPALSQLGCWCLLLYLVPALVSWGMGLGSAMLRYLLAGQGGSLPPQAIRASTRGSQRQRAGHEGSVRLTARFRFRPYRRQLRGVGADVMLPAKASPTAGGRGKGGSPLHLAMVQVDDAEEEVQAEVVASTVSSTMPDGMTHYPDVASYTKEATTGVTFGNSKVASPAVRAALVKLVTFDKLRVLSFSLKDLPGHSGPFPPCTVRMVHTRPVFERRRIHSALEHAIENEKCGEMLEAGLIEPSLSDNYASNLTFPAKKDAEGGYTDRRMCMDLRAINDATEFDRYAMPHPDVALDVVLGSVIFTILDLRSGYHQIPLLEEDRDKTSFWWGTKLYRYTRMVMGMKNSSAQFQRLVDVTLAAADLARCACGYIDDILIHSMSPEAHVVDVGLVLMPSSR